MAEGLFWTTVLTVAYAYVGYPVALWVWGRLIRRAPWPADRQEPDALPPVSIVIAAYNEAPRLAARLTNCLQLDYPADRLEVIVVSDGSTDGTELVLRQCESPRVRWASSTERLGKAAALNSGVGLATGDIVVFTDVRQRFASDAVRRLVSNFADPAVGAVSGELLITAAGELPHAPVTDLYWRYEKWIRKAESRVDSVIGATGAIYAIRRQLFEPLPVGTILDDVLTPMRIALRGYRVLFDERALAWDQAATDLEHEFRRKVRTLAGNYQLVALLPQLLSLRGNRLWFQFVSHKLSRLAVPFALIGLLLSSAVLAPMGWGYRLIFLLQFVAYGFALVGLVWGQRALGRLTAVPVTFVMLNYAAVLGLVEFARLRQAEALHRLWPKPETQRRAS